MPSYFLTHYQANLAVVAFLFSINNIWILFKVISHFRNYRPIFEILNSFQRILSFWRKKSNKLTSDRNEWKRGRKEDKKWNERKGWNVKYDPNKSDRVCVEGVFFFIFHNYWFSLWYRTISVSRKFLKVIEIGFTFHNKTLITCAKTFYPFLNTLVIVNKSLQSNRVVDLKH